MLFLYEIFLEGRVLVRIAFH